MTAWERADSKVLCQIVVGLIPFNPKKKMPIPPPILYLEANTPYLIEMVKERKSELKFSNNSLLNKSKRYSCSSQRGNTQQGFHKFNPTNPKKTNLNFMRSFFPSIYYKFQVKHRMQLRRVNDDAAKCKRTTPNKEGEPYIRRDMLRCSTSKGTQPNSRSHQHSRCQNPQTDLS